jgi:hypothetical protein
MKRLTAFFVSLYVVLLLSAPIVMAGEMQGGFAPSRDEGSNTGWLTKGDFVISQLLPLVLSLNSTVPLL